MRRLLFLIACLLCSGTCALAEGSAPDADAKCIACLTTKTPNIVSDWGISKHSKMGVTCSVCHGDQHGSDSDATKAQMPTIETCSQCHSEQADQFRRGKHMLAWAAMKAMPTIHWQPMAMIEGQKGCGGCHKIGAKSPEEIQQIRKEGSTIGSASCVAMAK